VYSGYDPVDVLRNENRRVEVCNGHGTHVAGLAGGLTHGVAKGATLYSVRVLDCQGTGSISMIACTHVIEQVQKQQSRRVVINLSLTTRKEQAMRDAVTAAIVTAAIDSGILVVAAAENYYSDACKLAIVILNAWLLLALGFRKIRAQHHQHCACVRTCVCVWL